MSYLVLVLFTLLCFSSCSQNSQSEWLFKCSNRLNDSYGIQAHIGAKHVNSMGVDADLRSIVGIGVDFVRCDYYWNFIQPTSKHHKDYKHLDILMSSIQEYKVNYLPILDYTIDEYRDIWNHVEEWGEYVEGLVDRYGLTNDYWEIWNEENLKGAWGGSTPSPEQYLILLKKASSIIRKKDSSSKILLGGLANMDMDYLEGLFKIGGAEYFDIVNIHYYNFHRAPEVIIGELYKLNSLLEKYDIKKEVWITETGYSTYPMTKQKYINQVSEEYQAIWLPRAFLTSFCYGVEKIFWYCHRTNEQRNDREGFFGIVHNDLTPKPAYNTYKTLIKMCPNKSLRPTLIRNGDVYMSSWKRPDGKRVWALWTSDIEETGDLSIKGKYRVYDINGKEIPNFGKGRINITPSVIYVVGARDVKWN